MEITLEFATNKKDRFLVSNKLKIQGEFPIQPKKVIGGIVFNFLQDWLWGIILRLGDLTN